MNSGKVLNLLRDLLGDGMPLADKTVCVDAIRAFTRSDGD